MPNNNQISDVEDIQRFEQGSVSQVSMDTLQFNAPQAIPAQKDIRSTIHSEACNKEFFPDEDVHCVKYINDWYMENIQWRSDGRRSFTFATFIQSVSHYRSPHYVCLGCGYKACWECVVGHIHRKLVQSSYDGINNKLYWHGSVRCNSHRIYNCGCLINDAANSLIQFSVCDAKCAARCAAHSSSRSHSAVTEQPSNPYSQVRFPTVNRIFKSRFVMG